MSHSTGKLGNYGDQIAAMRAAAENGQTTTTGDRKIVTSPPTPMPTPTPTPQKTGPRTPAPAPAPPPAPQLHAEEEHGPTSEPLHKLYKKPGITLYPQTERQVAEMLYFFVMNGVQIPGKRGLSLFTRAGIDELYDLYQNNQPAFLERMEKTTRSTEI